MYKLSYFDVPARGEVARWLFTLADQDFEDIRIQYADWPKIKPTTPFGQLPTLEVDGVTVCQSGAINNFLAKRFGFAGKDDMEQLRVDMTVGCIEDMVMQIVRPILYGPTDEAKAAFKKGAQAKVDAFFEKLEALLVSNNGGDGYFVGDALTLADLMYVARSTFPYKAQLRVPWIKLPKLKALKQRVLANPKIAAWRAKHTDPTLSPVRSPSLTPLPTSPPPAPASIRLTYFDTEGRAEVSRLLLHLAGATFEDIRLTQEEWLEIKANTPYGQLPLLDIDDDTICQSNTIARYIANRYGLAGKTNMEMTRADMVVDCIEDFSKFLVQWLFCQDVTQKATLHKQISEEHAPTFLKRMEGIMETNKESDKHFAGADTTWADVSFFSTAGWLVALQVPVDWAQFPRLKAVVDNVTSIPRIAEYVAKRPRPIQYVLTYFDLKGRGEVPRILMTIGKLTFEDRRIPGEDWPKLKPETPMGGLPTLQIGAETYCQSTAISRYLAKQIGMAGKTDEEGLKVDMIVDGLVDFFQGFRLYEKDTDSKEALVKTFREETAPFLLKKFETLLKKNHGGDGFFVGNDMTWADVFFMNVTEVLVGAGVDLKLGDYPKLQQLLQKTQKDPRVMAWTQKRPQ